MLAVPKAEKSFLLKSLRKRADFLNCAKSGKYRSCKTLTLQICKNDSDETRVGYTVSKKVSKLAVIRNRIKRRLRAAAREVLQEQGKQSHDYVIIGKTTALERSFEELKGDIKYCIKKIEEK